MRNNRGILTAALSGAIFLSVAGAALAAPAVATANVNVRTGPSSGYDAVDILRRGERVDVQGCEGGWCYVQKQGLDGWVSWQYLADINRPTRPSVTFQFNYGSPPRFDPPRHHGGPNRPGNGPYGPGGYGNHNGPDWNGGHGNNNGPGWNGGQGNNNGPDWNGGHHDDDHGGNNNDHGGNNNGNGGNHNGNGGDNNQGNNNGPGGQNPGYGNGSGQTDDCPNGKRNIIVCR